MKNAEHEWFDHSAGESIVSINGSATANTKWNSTDSRRLPFNEGFACVTHGSHSASIDQFGEESSAVKFDASTKQSEGLPKFISEGDSDMLTKDKLGARPGVATQIRDRVSYAVEKNEKKTDDKERHRTFTAHKLIDRLQNVARELENAGETKKSTIANFTAEAINSANFFDARNTGLGKEIEDFLNWRTRVSNKEAQEYRESAIRSIEQRSEQLWKSGQVTKRIAGSDPIIKRSARHANGPLLGQLCQDVLFEDIACVGFFKEGAPLVGNSPSQGRKGNKLNATKILQEIKATCSRKHMQTAEQLKENKHSRDRFRKFALMPSKGG